MYVCVYIYITYTYIYTYLYIYIYIPIVIAIKDTTIYRYLADSYMVDMYIYMIYSYNLFCGIYTINELVHLQNQFHRLYCRISCIRHISTIDRHSLVTGLSYSVKCISIWEQKSTKHQPIKGKQRHEIQHDFTNIKWLQNE